MRALVIGMLTVAIAGACSDAPPRVCAAAECTPEQWQRVFEQALTELRDEHFEVTEENFASGEAHARIGERMLALTNAPRVPMPAAKYSDQSWHCGTWIFSLPTPPCMNHVCYRHDLCYGAIAGYTSLCAWSSRTDYCDSLFFTEQMACADGWAQRFIVSVARGLKQLCDLPLAPAPAVCAGRIACLGCRGLDANSLCEQRGSHCGAWADGCGDVVTCGTCAPGETCVTDRTEELSGACAAAPTTCPDGACSGGETCATCPADCGDCCGDGTCGTTETCATCSADCGPCATCPNGACDGGETCATCAADCGPCATCPNGACDGGETCASCAADCGSCAQCPNGACDGGETCASCAADCGPCAACGDGVCSTTEDPASCATDCAPIAMAAERLGRVTQGGCGATTIGWHAGSTASAFWTYVTTCALPSVNTPDAYGYERMRWRWQIRKPGTYRVAVKIPAASDVCGFSLSNYSTAARYYLVRPGAGSAGDLRIVDQRSNAGLEATISSNLNTNAGELALYLYDSVTDSPACCECSTSLRVLHDVARVDWVGP